MQSHRTDLEAQQLLGRHAGTDTDTDKDDHLHPDLDVELKKNGGKFDNKFAVLQVTFRTPIDPHPLNIIALLYGFLPFLVPGALFVAAVVTRRFIFMFGICMSLIAVLINEALLKPLFDEPRPLASANRHQCPTTKKFKMKPGMPSGHVMNATCVMVWATLEVAFECVHCVGTDALTTKWLIGIVLVMAPVPWARWYNSDHSLNQCLVGGLLGIVFGIGAYYVHFHFFHQHEWAPWRHEHHVEALHVITHSTTTAMTSLATAVGTTLAQAVQSTVHKA